MRLFLLFTLLIAATVRAELPGEDELALDQPLADNDAVPNAADDSQFDEIANDEDEVEDPPEMMEDPDELEKLEEDVAANDAFEPISYYCKFCKICNACKRTGHCRGGFMKNACKHCKYCNPRYYWNLIRRMRIRIRLRRLRRVRLRRATRWGRRRRRSGRRRRRWG